MLNIKWRISMENKIKIIIAILGVIAAVIGIITAYILLKKAYVENNKNKNRGEGDTVDINNKISLKKVKLMGNFISHVGPHKELQEHNNESMHKEITSLCDDNIILKEKYTSIFAEKGEVHSEKIVIENLGNGKIKGEVYLDANYKYCLSGTFRNRILTGEFTALGKYKDERGTINLKQISENILSGFCSFSKISQLSDDQIRMSPYIWVAGDDTNLINGTYEFCTQCHNERKKCCCSSPDIDMPVLLNNEAQKIQSSDPRNKRMKDFSRIIGNTPIRQINAKTNKTNDLQCHFYDLEENKCKIYNMRPVDCRLFPFDIKLDTKTNEYWVGYYNDLCDRQLPDIETMKQYAHILRPQLFLLFPYANTINSDDVCKHLSKASFEKLYKLEEFIF